MMELSTKTNNFLAKTLAHHELHKPRPPARRCADDFEPSSWYLNANEQVFQLVCNAPRAATSGERQPQLTVQCNTNCSMKRSARTSSSWLLRSSLFARSLRLSTRSFHDVDETSMFSPTLPFTLFSSVSALQLGHVHDLSHSARQQHPWNIFSRIMLIFHYMSTTIRNSDSTPHRFGSALSRQPL